MMGPSSKIGGEKQKKKTKQIFNNRATGLVMDHMGVGDESSGGWRCPIFGCSWLGKGTIFFLP